MSRFKIWGLLLTLLLAFALAACGAETAAPTAEPSGEPAATAETTETTVDPTPAPEVEEEVEEGPRKVATFIFTQEFDSLSPIYTGMWFSGITTQIWNAAGWDFDADNNPQPVLVTEIPSLENGGISADGTTITLNLRDDIVWSDGTPLTSADFLFTYEMIMNPANAVGSTYPEELYTSIEAPDDRTVVVTFAEPFVPWTATMFRAILPKHVLQPAFEAEGTLDTAEWNRNPTVGAGPFVFAEWESGSYARFVRNENYYNEPAKIDEIFIRFVPDDAAQVAALQTGDADLGTFIAYSDVPTLKDAGVNILSVPSGYNEGWFFYLGEDGHPALQDVRVRQAIAYGLNRQAINQDLLLGLTQPAISFWDNSPYQAPELEAYPYDMAMANSLLDEAGWVDSNGDGTRDKDGVELVLVHGTTNRQIRQDLQAVAQNQLAEIGITLEIVSQPSDIYFASYAEGGPCGNGELDICESSNTASFPDPDTSRFLCNQIPSDESPDGANDQKLCDEALDALFVQQAAQVDFNARQETFYAISRLMHEQMYWLGIWQDPDIWALSSRLTGVELSGSTPFSNIAEWDIE